MPGIQETARAVLTSIEESTTAQKYQAIADILHYQVGVPKSGANGLFESDTIADTYLDNPEQYGLYGVGALTGFDPDEIPAPLKAINSPTHIETLVKWASKKALEKSFARIVEKFKLDPNSAQSKEIFTVLENIYNLDSSDATLQSNLNQLKIFLIIARLEKKFKTSIPENLKKEITDYVNAGQQGNRETLIGILQSELGQSAQAQLVTPEKLKTILTKFPILRKIETPEQVRERVKDETIGVIHDSFAQEIELLNKVERITFSGDETLYRGIPASALSEETIIAGFSKIHRAISKSGSVATHQIKTAWNKIWHPDFSGSIASNTTASSTNPMVAITYSTDRHNKGSGDKQGWVFEIRPKSGQTAVALASYEQRGGGGKTQYAELDFPQVDPNEIVAVHLVTKKQDGSTIVEKSIPNPYYKKRTNERGLEQIPPDPFFIKGARLTQQKGDFAADIKVTHAGTAQSIAPNINTAYLQHIDGKTVSAGDALTQKQIRAKRLASQKPKSTAPVAQAATDSDLIERRKQEFIQKASSENLYLNSSEREEAYKDKRNIIFRRTNQPNATFVITINSHEKENYLISVSPDGYKIGKSKQSHSFEQLMEFANDKLATLQVKYQAQQEAKQEEARRQLPPQAEQEIEPKVQQDKVKQEAARKQQEAEQQLAQQQAERAAQDARQKEEREKAAREEAERLRVQQEQLKEAYRRQQEQQAAEQRAREEATQKLAKQEAEKRAQQEREQEAARKQQEQQAEQARQKEEREKATKEATEQRAREEAAQKLATQEAEKRAQQESANKEAIRKQQEQEAAQRAQQEKATQTEREKAARNEAERAKMKQDQLNTQQEAYRKEQEQQAAEQRALGDTAQKIQGFISNNPEIKNFENNYRTTRNQGLKAFLAAFGRLGHKGRDSRTQQIQQLNAALAPLQNNSPTMHDIKTLKDTLLTIKTQISEEQHKKSYKAGKSTLEAMCDKMLNSLNASFPELAQQNDNNNNRRPST